MTIEPDLRQGPRLASVEALERCLAGSLAEGATRRPLRNPHDEPRVTPAERRRAVPAAVLIPVVCHASEPTLVLTRRHEQISYPGHICFPGGRADPLDRDVVHTALREAEEEIALAPDAVRVIGRLGDYVSHSGFRIAPIVGTIEPPLCLSAAPGEVEEILEIPLSHVLDPRAYRLERFASEQLGAERPRGYFVLEYAGARVTGPTIGILIGLREAMLAA